MEPNRIVQSRDANQQGLPRGKFTLRGLVDSLGRLFAPNSESEAVTTRTWLDARPDIVWKTLRFYEEVTKRPGVFLLALLPRPIRSEGEKTRVDASVRCVYEGGHMVKRITAAEPEHLLRFEVLEQHLGIENCLSTGEGSYEILPAQNGSEVLLTTHYRGHLRPRSLWRPFERIFAHQIHRHILEGMRAALPP